MRCLGILVILMETLDFSRFQMMQLYFQGEEIYIRITVHLTNVISTQMSFPPI